MTSAATEFPFDPATPLRTLLRCYGKTWPHLIFATIFYVIKQSPIWLLPLLSANIIDLVITNPSQHLTEVLSLGALMALDVVQNIPTHYLYIRHLSIATRMLEKNLRTALTRRFQYLSMHFYHGRDSGMLQTKVIRDVEMLQQTIQMAWDSVPSAIIALIVTVVVTALRVPWFLLFYAITIPIAAAIILHARTKLRRENQQFREHIESVATRVSEMLQMIPLTRAHGSEQAEIQRGDAELEQLRTSGRNLDGVNAIFNATSWVSLRLFDTLCLIVAALLAITHAMPMTVGDIILLTGYYRSITDAVVQLTTVVPQLSKGLESFASLGEILADPDIEQNDGKASVDGVTGAFRFEQVAYFYPHAGTPSLIDINVDVAPGQMIAIVGASGSGKSTLINQIIGFLRPTQGRILLDGRDMETLDLRTYRRFLAVVSQDTILFAGSIRDNILYGAPSCTEDEYQQVLDAAQVREFIDRLPLGDHTLIGARGAMLSGGQRQRIAIARALIRNPHVLILDEATAALDPQSEALVQAALAQLFHQRTAFVVAHRLATIERADQIIVMEHGHIKEIGTHTALMESHGTYARLHAALPLP